MGSGTKLRIVWDGDAPGLAEQKLSLAAFREPLNLLLSAFRRVASGVVTNALGGPSYGRKGGRFAKAAEAIDLSIIALEKGSLDLHLDCAVRPPAGATLEMFLAEDLPRETTRRFLQDLRAEARGELRNASVRKFLNALPKGIRSHRYEAYDDGVLVEEVQFGDAILAEPPPEFPTFLRLDGEVLGVSFDPERPEVRIRSEEGTVTCSATLAQVERAVQMHTQFVSALAVESSGKPRLLWLRLKDTGYPDVPPERREELLFGKWDALLRRLAQ